MKRIVVITVVFFGLFALHSSVSAENLPKLGTISLQTIIKASAPTIYNDDYSHNGVTGVTFNEEGSGPLHLGKVACSVSTFSRSPINKSIGFCTYDDKDGDNIFVQYTGTSDAKGEFKNVSDIIGGTGKFEGISGAGSGRCTNTDKKGEFPCSGKFDYRLPV